MKEVLPQFSYTDQLLTFNLTAPSDEDEILKLHYDDSLSTLDELSGIIIESADAGHTVSADVSQYFKKDVYTYADDERLVGLLGPINTLTPFKPKVDVGLNLATISRYGIKANICPSFQSWLQTTGTEREPLIAAAENMSAVFGLPRRRAIGHYDIVAVSESTEFELHALEMRPDDNLQRTGNIEFFVPFLQTLGNCACLGSSGSERDIFVGYSDYADLYTLEPHNVDDVRQSLSMIVGLGTLAAQMPVQFDETQLFASASWHREEVYPHI